MGEDIEVGIRTRTGRRSLSYLMSTSLCEYVESVVLCPVPFPLPRGRFAISYAQNCALVLNVSISVSLLFMLQSLVSAPLISTYVLRA